STMEAFSFPHGFQQIFITNDGIAHLLNEPTLRRTLDNCYQHLCTGGQLTLDITNFDVELLGRFSGLEREFLRDRGRYRLNENHNIQVWEQTRYNRDDGI